ncbi:MAG: threonine--tRNA ligase [Phycisphaerae bacterium]|nr:threonine--tRNA ligase [Phycisphaerae bacterium]
MPQVRLPDGKVLEVPSGSSVRDVASKIGPGLAKAAVAARLDGDPVDLSVKLPDEGQPTLEILTAKSDVALDILRHSTAHIMAQAVGRLHQNVKYGIGPSIENGFYYDFDLPVRLTEEDLPRIEDQMRRIVAEKQPFSRRVLSVDEARREMAAGGQDYKVEMIDDLARGGDGVAPVETVSFYTDGGFTDLCRGPHLPDTGVAGAFKLTHVAGAYWRGDEKRPMLQRIYGTAFWTQKELDEHLARIEEAKRRDHRRIGIDLDLFSFHDEGPGFAFFHPKGTVIWNALVDFWREVHRRHGYGEIRTPVILSESLWHQSGHWDHYRNNMYFTQIDERPFAVKPMNCPGGMLVYKSRSHSYKEFPLKNAELGLVHRHELSGVLHGLMRVRQFTQDDAHVFCMPEQLADEVAKVIALTRELYAPFHFEEIRVELSTRPSSHTIGSDEMWEMATGALREALTRSGMDYKVNEGDGAFYGPKIDFHLRDCLGRTHQCATIQADFAMPERFDLTYVGADNREHRPVMIHRAIYGSLERFLGIILEHFGGAMPLWLSPVQAIVLPVSQKFDDYALEVQRRLHEAGLRVEVDLRSDKIGAKIRDATMQKVPYMLVVGGREAESGAVSVRERSSGDLGSMEVARFASAANEEAKSRGDRRVAEACR